MAGAVAVCGHVTAVQTADGLCDGQPDAAATVSATSGVTAVEALEHMSKLLIGDPLTGVRHGDRDRAVLGSGRDPHQAGGRSW